jgi:hypothetical protein
MRRLNAFISLRITFFEAIHDASFVPLTLTGLPPLRVTELPYVRGGRPYRLHVSERSIEHTRSRPGHTIKC